MKPWTFLQNPFLHACDNNFLKGMDISLYHDTALSASQSDPFILSMYEAFHPLHLNYQTAYDIWLTQGHLQQGETLNVKQLLDLLAYTKIKRWDIAIQSLYPQGTPEYKALLPHRRKPFQNGGQEKRIQALQALHIAIGTDEALTSVKSEISAFEAQLETAFGVQKQSKSTTRSKSSELETARVAMCVCQYANLGLLMHKYPTKPDKIELYFDLQSIRRSPQVYFTGHVKPGAVHTIAKHTFAETDQVTLSGKGAAQLKFYLAHAKDMKPGDTYIIPGKEELTVLAGSLGKLTDKFITVINTDPWLIGEFSVEFV